MPVPAQTTLFNESTANGVTTVFPYEFMIAAAGDITVELDGVVTTTGFTLTGVGEEGGGTIVFSTAPANGVVVLRYLDSELSRATDYQQFGDLNADTVDQDFDRLWLAMQSLALKLGLCVRAPISSASGVLPEPVANNVIGWNATATGFENYAPVDNTLLAVDLASTASGKGATLVGIEDAAGYYAGSNVEVALADLGRTRAATVSVKDPPYLATGDGIADDTTAIDDALAVSDGPFFPDGTYLYTGDVDGLFDSAMFGPGVIKYDGYEYPVKRGDSLNVLWPGEFRCWPMGHALGVETVQRRQIPAGVTHARLNFAAGMTVSHVEGEHYEDAMRVQRNAGNTATDSHTVVVNLTREETKTLAGERCVIQFHGQKGATYSGGDITYRVQYSVEPDQPILNADGTYTSGNVNLLTGTVTLGASPRPKAAPYFAAFDLPVDATQVAVVFVVPFAGTADDDDWIEIEGLSVHVGRRPASILRESFADLMVKAKSRYQSSYPYGAPRGTSTEQGTVSAVAINTATAWAFSIPVRFDPPMATVPQFLFQSPTSSTESRLLNKDSGVTINGLAHALNEAGAVITNNGAATAGNRYLCHWTAQVIF